MLARSTAVLLLVGALLLALAGGAGAQQRLFAVDGAGGAASTLYELDPATGAVIQTIGPIGFDHVTGIAFHPLTGVLYGVVSDEIQGELGALITIDPTTGAGTLVGLTNAQIPDISFAADGTLYGWVEFETGGVNFDDLFTIDLATGAITLVGVSNFGTASTGMAFAPDGTLYVKPGGLFHTVDPGTGLSSGSFFVSSPTGTPQNMLAFDENGVAYSGRRTGPSSSSTDSELLRIDLVAQTATSVGLTGIGTLSGLAFQPQAFRLLTDASQLPGSTSVIDFSDWPNAVFTVGPEQVGDLVGEDVVFTGVGSTGFSFDGYGLLANGTWVAPMTYAFVNVGDTASIRFTFNDGPVSAVGGFVNYAPGHSGDLVLRALGSQGETLATFSVNQLAPISTPAGVNEGAFRGIASTSANIHAFELAGGVGVIDDLAFTRSLFQASLEPAMATNVVGTEHTLTAHVVDELGAIAGSPVDFEIVSGPNAGRAGACSPNPDCTTDATGTVSFRYRGLGGVGEDVIAATALDRAGAQLPLTPDARKTWVLPTPQDSYLSTPARDTNHGGESQLMLSIVPSFPMTSTPVVQFDLTGVERAALASAQLVLSLDPSYTPNGWGTAGFDVGAHALGDTFVEGDGAPGSGPGVTWNCAVDAEIANTITDCAAPWNGGAIDPTPTDTVLHTNGQSGEVSFDVTSDVRSGWDGWLVTRLGGGGFARYVSREGAALLENPALAPRLELGFEAEFVLYAVTGDGAESSESLFTMDQSTAQPTFLSALGAGDSGEAIAFDPDDGLLYHLSGLNTPVFETIDPSSCCATVASIPLSGDERSSTLGMTHDPVNGGFLVSDRLTAMLQHISTDGVVTTLGPMDHLSKGLAFMNGTLYSVARFDAMLRTIDPATGATLSAVPMVASDLGSISGATGLATNPATGELFALVDGLDAGGFVLARVDPGSGAAEVLGDTGDLFAGITFVPASLAGEMLAPAPPPPACGLGIELVIALPLLWSARYHARRWRTRIRPTASQ